MASGAFSVWALTESSALLRDPFRYSEYEGRQGLLASAACRPCRFVPCRQAAYGPLFPLKMPWQEDRTGRDRPGIIRIRPAPAWCGANRMVRRTTPRERSLRWGIRLRRCRSRCTSTGRSHKYLRPRSPLPGIRRCTFLMQRTNRKFCKPLFYCFVLSVSAKIAI